jgi:hypothetical protein
VDRLMGTPGELVEQLRLLAETVQLHDDHIRAIEEVLSRLMERPVPPRRQSGFHVRGDEPDEKP